MSKKNYWCSKLGFDAEDHSVASRNTNAISTVPVVITAIESKEAVLVNRQQDGKESVDALETWIEEFSTRLAAKEAEATKRSWEQLHRDDIEIEKWKVIRLEDERIEKEREAEELRKQAALLAQQEQDAAAMREQERILAATEGLTEEQRQLWVADERELEELEAKSSRNAQRLEELNQVLRASAAILDEKLAKEAAAQAQEVERVNLELAQWEQGRTAERERLVEDECGARASVEAEEPLSRATVIDLLLQERRNIERAARELMYTQSSAQVQMHADAMSSEAERDHFLDELVLLQNMERTLARLHKSSR